MLEARVGVPLLADRGHLLHTDQRQPRPVYESLGTINWSEIDEHDGMTTVCNKSPEFFEHQRMLSGSIESEFSRCIHRPECVSSKIRSAIALLPQVGFDDFDAETG